MGKQRGRLLLLNLIFLGFCLRILQATPIVQLSFKDFSQPNLFYCGPTVIYSVLNYWGIENTDFCRIVELVYNKRSRVSTNSSMMASAACLGFKAYSFTADFQVINTLLRKKIPVIVFQNFSARIQLGHFRIVVGINLNTQKIYFKDPSKRKTITMSFSRFSRLWQRGTSINNKNWAMIFVPGFLDIEIKQVLNSPVTFLNKATYYYKNFKYLKALSVLKEGLPLNKANPDFLKYYAQVLVRLKMWAEAEKTCRTLMGISDSDPVVYDLLGLISFYTNRYKQALEHLTKAMDLNKNNKENLFIKKHYDSVKKYVSQIRKKE